MEPPTDDPPDKGGGGRVGVWIVQHYQWRRRWKQRRPEPRVETIASRRWTYTCEVGHETNIDTIAEWPPTQLPCADCGGPARLPRTLAPAR